MQNAEASRRAAHMFLDAAAVNHRDDPIDDDTQDDMRALALAPLADVGAITMFQDEESGRISLDMRPAYTGILLVITALLDGWAACADTDRDLLIAELREIIDEHLRET